MFKRLFPVKQSRVATIASNEPRISKVIDIQRCRFRVQDLESPDLPVLWAVEVPLLIRAKDIKTCTIQNMN